MRFRSALIFQSHLFRFRARVTLASLVVLSVFALNVVAQSANEKGVGVADRSDASMARFEELRAAGFESLYNLDYDAAVQKFKEIQTLFPDHPAGPQFLAAALWSKVLNQSRRLQSSLYNSESFYTQKEDKPDPQMLEQFRTLTRTAAQLAKARLRRNPKDVEALYFLGATEGLKAAFGMTVQRSFMSALSDGSSSVDRHREVIKLDPNFHDAELTIGLYDYVVGNLPLAAKLVASFVGARGSKKRGIKTLESVAKEGHWERDDARLLLMALYKHEGRLADSLVLSRELQERYLHNYLFKLETADTLVSQAAHERQENRGADANML